MYILKIVKCTYLLASKMALIAIFVCTFQVETNLTFISFLTTVQLVDPAKSLLHGYHTRPYLLLGLDPVKLARRGGLSVCEWVPFRTQLDQ